MGHSLSPLCLITLLSLGLFHSLATAAAIRRDVNNSVNVLALTKDMEFKISIFSDLHYGEDESTFGPGQDINSEHMFHHVLDAENPDLVVLNGDLITGENTFRQNSTNYVDVIVKPLVEGGYRWASTYGNHDSKYNLLREDVYERETTYPQALTLHGPEGTDGVTNYVLPLYRAKFSLASDKPVALFYFFDSQGGSRGDPSNNDNIGNWVTERTASWFTKKATEAEKNWGVLPSFVFVHIPIHAFTALQENSSGPELGSTYYPGLNLDNPAVSQGIGAVGGNIYTGQDIPFMQALLNTRGLHSIYSGHVHGNSWCGLWPEESTPNAPSSNRGNEFASNGRPFLCFCKHSSFAGYGRQNRGVRQLKLRFDKKGLAGVDTWVRMQSGVTDPQIVTKVRLNSTYGTDEYPTETGGYLY